MIKMERVLTVSFFLLLLLILYLPPITSGKERSSGSSNEKLVKVYPGPDVLMDIWQLKYILL